MLHQDSPITVDTCTQCGCDVEGLHHRWTCTRCGACSPYSPPPGGWEADPGYNDPPEQ
jgi:hypothetical protein